MHTESFVWLAIGGGLSMFVGALGARSLNTYSQGKLSELGQQHDASGMVTEIFRFRHDVSLALQVLRAAGSTMFSVGLTCSIASRLEMAHPFWAWILAICCAICGVLLVEVWLCRLVAHLWGPSVVLSSWRLWKVLLVPLWPLVRLVRTMDHGIARLLGKQDTRPSDEAFQEEVQSMMLAGEREGLMEGQAREMIVSVMNLDEVTIREIMTPRTEMLGIDADSPWAEILTAVIEGGHTRVPVFGEDRDEIVGILHLKDLLPELTAEGGVPKRPLANFLRKPFFVPESKSIKSLLQEFQEHRSHIAIVVDEFGGVCGLVTIEDILEEIVGEIHDEHDEASEAIRRISETAVEVPARMNVEDINKQLGINLPEPEDTGTIGGLVFSRLGHLPSVGTEVVFDGVRVIVTEATKRRAHRVRIEFQNPATELPGG